MDNKIEKIMQKIILIAVPVACGLLTVLDISGILKLDFFSNNINYIILILLSLLSAFIVFSIHDEAKYREEGINRAVKEANGLKIIQFDNSIEFYNYLSKRIKSARFCVDDLSWATRGKTEMPHSEKEKRAFERLGAAKNSTVRRGIQYREVVTFPTLRRYNRTIKLIEAKNSYYQLRYYELPTKDLMPRMVFTIIDKFEIVFLTHRFTDMTTDEMRLVLGHETIMKLFQDYYEAIWMNATLLSDGEYRDIDLLENIRLQLVNKVVISNE